MTLREALEILLDVEHAADWIYAVREREGLGWEGPRVGAYSKAIEELRLTLQQLQLGLLTTVPTNPAITKLPMNEEER